jgi:fibronectin-binding autotransporter adhesin
VISCFIIHLSSLSRLEASMISLNLHGRLLLAVIAGVAGVVASRVAALGQVSGTWINLVSGTWSNGSNWTSNPLFPDGGGIATIEPGGIAIRLDTPVTLGGISFQPARFSSIAGGSLTLVGPAQIDTPFALPGPQANVQLAGSGVSSSISGSVGLTKTGPGLLWLTGSNSFTGGLYIGGGTILASTNAALGASGGSIILNGGVLAEETSGFAIGRNVLVGAAGGAFFKGNPGSDIHFDGLLSGSGTFSQLGDGSLYLSADSPFTGTFQLGSGLGKVTLLGNGALRGVSRFVIGGTFSLDNGSGVNFNRVSDSAQIVLNGGTLETRGGGTLSERVGNIALGRGTNWLRLDSPGIAASQLVRENRAAAYVAGTALKLDTPPALIGGGGPIGTPDASIIPWAFVESNLVTYDSTGLRTVNTYLPNIPAGSITTANVRLSPSGTFTVAAPATINALVIGASNVSVLGTSTLTITSGVILNGVGAGAIFTPIDFGAAEGLLNVSGGSLTISGVISGSNGLTISPLRTQGQVILSGVNTYTGPTTLNDGTVRFAGNVLPGVPGAFGNDTSAVVLNESVYLSGTNTNAAVFARDLIIRSGLDPSTSRFPTIGGTFTVSGNVALQGILNASGPAFTGTISGPGTIRIGSTSFARLSGNNTFTGGVWDLGTLLVGSDTALGTGTTVFSRIGETDLFAAATLTSVGGPRTLSNPIAIGNLATAGTFATTFSGPVSLNGGLTHLRVFGAPFTITGSVSNGLLSLEAGSLTLSGINSQYATSISNNATLTVTSSFGLGGAIGRPPLLTSVGTLGALQLTGGLNIPAHRLSVASGSIGLRSIAGNNVWAGDVVRSDGVLRIAVDSDSLRIGGNLDLANGSMEKSGAGVLEVPSLHTTAGVNVASGTLAVRASLTHAVANSVGSLAIAGGTVPTATLDLANSDLIIDYADVSPLPTIRAQIATAYAGGTWSGRGITSSLADARVHTLGSAESSEIFTSFPATFGGQSVDATAVLIRYTWYGDADLDGDVDITDLGRLASHWQSTGVWSDGDFDYSGVVDVSDLGLFASNWQRGVAGGSAAANQAFTEAMSLVGLPEPAGGLLIAFAVALPILRRRRGTLIRRP